MGPNKQDMTRKQYVKYRLRVLKELHIAPPDESTIDKMMDESVMSEIAVDNVFKSCLNKAKDVY